MISELTMIGKKVELRATTVTSREEGIMHFDLKKVDEYTKQDVNDVLTAVGEIGNGRAFANLVTINDYVEIDKEAKILSASEGGNRYTIADAFVLKSMPLKLLGNFYLQINKPVRPTRLFNDETSALKWLKTFL